MTFAVLNIRAWLTFSCQIHLKKFEANKAGIKYLLFSYLEFLSRTYIA